MPSSSNDPRGMTLAPQACKERRRELGLTQEKLAERACGALSLSLATIKRAERGLPIDLTSAQTLSTLLDVALERLRADDDSARAVAQGESSEPRCALAVLPFELLPMDPHDQPLLPFLGEGLMDDLLSSLGRWWFPVISRCSTAMLRGTSLDARALGARLAARYVVSGSIRSGRGGMRISAQLTDTSTGLLVWSGAYDCSARDVLSVQAEVSQALARCIGRSLLCAETSRVGFREDATDLTGWDLALRGAWHYYRCTSADNTRARALLQAALERAEPALCTLLAVHDASARAVDALVRFTESCAGELAREL